MPRSVSPERIEQAELQRADMAAATRVQGVLIPPGTSVVVLSYDGPVDVPRLHNALGQMIEDGDLRGLPAGALEPAPVRIGTRDGTDFWIDGEGHTHLGAIGGEIAGPVFAVGERGCANLPAPDAARAILEDAHEYGQRIAGAVTASPAPALPSAHPGPARPEGIGPLEHLRAHGPATAAQLAAALGVTRQKAALDLAALVRGGQAVKAGKTYSALSVEQDPAAEQGRLQPEQ